MGPFQGEGLTGPNVVICEAYLLDCVAFQGIDASSPVFAYESSESTSDGGRLGIKCKVRTDIVLSRERPYFKGGIVLEGSELHNNLVSIRSIFGKVCERCIQPEGSIKMLAKHH